MQTLSDYYSFNLTVTVVLVGKRYRSQDHSRRYRREQQTCASIRVLAVWRFNNNFGRSNPAS
jgi:hypothetical protein